MAYNENLIKLIIEDKKKSNTYDRYPVRFLFTRLNSETYNDISELILQFTSMRNNENFNELKVIRLSSLLTYDDGWLTKNAIYNTLSELETDKDYIILGFSELARFYSKSDLQSLIMSFMTDIESTSQKNKQRIYFICFSLFEKLEEILKINGRNANINPILYLDDFVGSDSICVYYANSNFEFDKTNIIHNTNEWLSLYEMKNIDYNKGIVCLSDTLVSIYEKAKPDNFVEIYKIDSYFSLLVRMYGLTVSNKNESQYNDQFWKDIYKLSEKYKTINLRTLSLKYLKVQDIQTDNFLELFIKTDLFGKRLLLSYLEEYENDIKYSYFLKETLQKSNLNDFISVVNDVLIKFNILNNDIFFDGRKYYIKQLFYTKKIDRDFNQDGLLLTINNCFNSYISNKILTSKLEDENILEIDSKYLSEKYNQNMSYINNVLNQFFNEHLKKIFTGDFKIEQYIIMNLLSKSIISIEDAKSVYVELESYLGKLNNNFINSSKYWISNYIYEYRLSKILSFATDKFKCLSSRNTEEFMYTWYSNSDFAHQQDLIEINDYDKLIVLDGVGIEYFDYILYIIQSNGKYINYANYAKSYLPSITSINKKKILKYDKWIPDFDKNRIHGVIYNAIQAIPDSLEYIKEIIINLINDNPNSKICITADHGCTCQSKLIPYDKKFYFTESDHEGRCMEVKGNLSNIDDQLDYCKYTSLDDEKKYIISLNNVSLNDKPLRECHGGASIEECFVPCIIFSNNNVFQNYNINPIKTTINGLDRIIKLEITPKPKNNPIFIDSNGDEGLFKEENDNVWYAEIKNIFQQKIKVMIESYEYYILITSSSGMSMKGDDGFDD